MMMPPATPNMAPMAGGYAPPGMPAGQMPVQPQMSMQAPQQDLPPQMRMQLISALENFASR